jgi:hypothetical protein
VRGGSQRRVRECGLVAVDALPLYAPALSTKPRSQRRTPVLDPSELSLHPSGPAAHRPHQPRSTTRVPPSAFSSSPHLHFLLTSDDPMGQTLSEPVVEKHTAMGEDARLAWGVSEMQGWRLCEHCLSRFPSALTTR